MPGRTTAAWSSVRAAAPTPTGASRSTSPFSQYRPFGSRKSTGSGLAIASWIIVNASWGEAGLTTRSPAVCANSASGLSLWCSTAPIPPPNGTRITTGSSMRPAVRKWIFASWVVIWS